MRHEFLFNYCGGHKKQQDKKMIAIYRFLFGASFFIFFTCAFIIIEMIKVNKIKMRNRKLKEYSIKFEDIHAHERTYIQLKLYIKLNN